MYKIYIGEVPICLISAEEKQNFDSKNFRNLLMPFNGRRHLHRYIDNLEKGGAKSYDSIIVWSKDLKTLKEEFFSIYRLERAAGGLVSNAEGAYLAIFRRGHWDLPKGKMEEGEEIEETAVREVQEETGIEQIKLGAYLTTTYHTFKNRKGERILKESIWYAMQTTDTLLTPQTEEDIEKACWLNKTDFLEKTPIYKNILQVLAKV